jgi:hypothetical protein
MKTFYSILFIFFLFSNVNAYILKDTNNVRYRVKENLHIIRCIQNFTDDQDVYNIFETMTDSVYVILDEKFYKVDKNKASGLLIRLRSEFLMFGYSISYREEDGTYMLSYNTVKFDKMMILHFEFYVHKNVIYAIKAW